MHRVKRKKRHPLSRAGDESGSGRLPHKTLSTIDTAVDSYTGDRRSTSQNTHQPCNRSPPKQVAITRNAASHDGCPRCCQNLLTRHARRPTRQRKKIHCSMDSSQKFASQSVLHHHRCIPHTPNPGRTGTFWQVSYQPERIHPRPSDTKNTSLHGGHALHRKPSMPFNKGADRIARMDQTKPIRLSRKVLSPHHFGGGRQQHPPTQCQGRSIKARPLVCRLRLPRQCSRLGPKVTGHSKAV